jgi:CubicO group peptidase (beta-lactamase class C family)
LPADYVTSSLSANGWYGYQWWILNAAYFSGEPAAIEVASAQGLDGQYIFVWPDEDVVIVVLSQYSHPVEQGYIIDLASAPLNYPDTCTARNTCPGAIGGAVPSFSLKTLVERMVPLGDSP